MRYLPISGLPFIEEKDVDPETLSLFAEIKHYMGFSFVPNMDKALASSPNAIRLHIAMITALNTYLALPEALVSMIFYCISTAKNCTYCSVNYELFCRTLGIDEETLNKKLAQDLGNVSPLRLQAIIEFAVKCALDPQGLGAEDYERLRAKGVNEAELIEIILLAVVGNMIDTLADGLKIDVEEQVLDALGQLE